jgi:hypothetical protein
MTPSGIEPATFRYVAQYLNHCATISGPPFYWLYSFNTEGLRNILCQSMKFDFEYPISKTPKCLRTTKRNGLPVRLSAEENKPSRKKISGLHKHFRWSNSLL